METQLNRLFQEWQLRGAAVLLAQTTMDSETSPSHEALIAESTVYCRHSGRLTWIVIDWLLQHGPQIAVPEVLAETNTRGDLAVLGLIANAANERAASPTLAEIMHGCVPNPQPDFFFHRVKRSRLASRLTLENPLPLFQKWNFWCNELRYLNQSRRGV